MDKISNIIDTSIKLSISGQSTPMVNSGMDMVDTAFGNKRALIVCYFFQESSKVKVSSLYVIWNVHTAFLLLWGSVVRIEFWLHTIQTQWSQVLFTPIIQTFFYNLKDDPHFIVWGIEMLTTSNYPTLSKALPVSCFYFHL